MSENKEKAQKRKIYSKRENTKEQKPKLNWPKLKLAEVEHPRRVGPKWWVASGSLGCLGVVLVCPGQGVLVGTSVLV